MRKKFVASSHLGDRPSFPSFSVMHIFTIIVFYACKFLLKRFDQFVYLKHSRKSDFLNFDFLSGDPNNKQTHTRTRLPTNNCISQTNMQNI